MGLDNSRGYMGAVSGRNAVEMWVRYNEGSRWMKNQYGKPRRFPWDEKVHGYSAASLAMDSGMPYQKGKPTDSGRTSSEDTDRWYKARKMLFDACKAENPRASDKSCTCEDDSRLIPCDGGVHVRTFGPVIPSWPGLEVFADHKDGTLDSRKKQGLAHLQGAIKTAQQKGEMPNDQRTADFLMKEGPFWFNSPKFRWDVSNPPVPPQSAIAKPRRVTKDSFLLRGTGAGPILASLNVVKSKLWPDKSQSSDLERARNDLLRQFIEEDGSNLQAQIQAWVAKIRCEEGSSPTFCAEVPDVVGNPQLAGGSAADTAPADGAGKDNWYVSQSAGGDGTFMIETAACVKAMFKCRRYVLIPPYGADIGGVGSWMNRASANTENQGPVERMSAREPAVRSADWLRGEDALDSARLARSNSPRAEPSVHVASPRNDPELL